MKTTQNMVSSKFFALAATIFFYFAPAMAQGESTLIWDTDKCSGPYEPWYSHEGSGSSISPVAANFQTNWCEAGGTARYTQSNYKNWEANIGFDWLADEEIDISSHAGICVTYSLVRNGYGTGRVWLALTSSKTPLTEDSWTGDTTYNEYYVVLDATASEKRKCFDFSEFASRGSTNVSIEEVLENSKGLEFQFRSSHTGESFTLTIKKIEWPKYDEWPLTIEGSFADRVLWESEGCADETGYRSVNGGFGYNGQWYAFVNENKPPDLNPAVDDNFHFNLCKKDGNVQYQVNRNSNNNGYAAIAFNLSETYADIRGEEGVCLTYSLSRNDNNMNNILQLEIVPREGGDGSVTANIPPTNGQEVRRCFMFASDFQQSSLSNVLRYTKTLQLKINNAEAMWPVEVAQLDINIKKIEWAKLQIRQLQGSGTEQDPYIITDAEELEFVAKKVNSGDENYGGAGVYYELGNDIDLSAYANWMPIGNVYGYWEDGAWHQRDSLFKANFDGKGYKIRNLKIISRSNLTINGNEYRGMGTGLFGVISGTVQNLGLENVNIIADGDGVGGIAGQLWGSITNSYVAGGVIRTNNSTDAYGDRSYGGIAGIVSGNINFCYSTADIYVNTEITDGGIVSAGGIAGYVFHDEAYDAPGSVKNSMALGRIVSNKGEDGFTGRIVYGDGIYMNNTAFSEMLDKDNNAEWNNKGSGNLDGEDREAYELYEASGYLPAFTTSPWTYEAGKLPGLNGEPVDMPNHIPSGITRVAIAPKTVSVQVGTSQSFAAVVYGFGDFPQTVVWSRQFVSGHNDFASYNITDKGVLTINAEENPGAVVRVIVTAGYNGVIKRDTAIVTVVAEPVPPAIQGDAELTLREGYGAVSTNAYSIIGTSQPITVAKTSGDAKITWNSATNKLDIDEGLAERTYEIELEAEDNAGRTSTFTFTLTVLPLPTVTSVTVTPSTATVQKNQSQQFTAIVTAIGGADEEVVWSVSGNTVATTNITEDGLLTIGALESATQLTVTATSTYNTSVKGAATVTIDASTPILAGTTNANMLNARMQNGTLHISGLTAGKTWSIYTISGTLVKQSVASGTNASVSLKIPRGVYIVKNNRKIVRFVNK